MHVFKYIVTWTQLWRSYRAWPQKRRLRTDNENFFYENDPHVWHWKAELWLVESQVLVVKPTSNVYGIEFCLHCLNWSLCGVLQAFIHQLFDHTQIFKINWTWCKEFAGFPIWRFTDWKCMKFSSGCSQNPFYHQSSKDLLIDLYVFQVCASYLCRKKRSPSNCKKHKSPVQAASKTHQDISCPPCTVQLRFINKLEVLNYMVHLCNQLKCIIFSRMSSFTCCIARYLNCGMYTIGPWV